MRYLNKMIEKIALPKYRHEYKYLNDEMQKAVLKARVKAVMKPDRYAGNQNCYRVRSLYFDSFNDSCYYENESGIGERAKYRIRIYNANAGRIVLEKKSKRSQMTIKESCHIDEAICRQLMLGQGIQLTSNMKKEQIRLLGEMQRMTMRPVVIVEYLRYPFVFQSGNVRVTFDENINSSNDISHFLEERIVSRPVLPKGMSVLEVKWDEFLPTYIKEYIQLETLQWSSFSKYYLCRKYNTYGGIRI